LRNPAAVFGSDSHPVRRKARGGSVALAGLLLGFALSASFAAQADDRPFHRLQYPAAVKAIETARWEDAREQRRALEDYPLAVYLDYLVLAHRARHITPREVLDFIQSHQATPLPNRLRHTYLSRAGRDGRWRDFLAVSDGEPYDIELKCFYFRALAATGDRAQAWRGAERLWLHGESRPKACDPLFQAWVAAGNLSDDIVWHRLLATFDARQRSLMRYVASRASANMARAATLLQEVYDSPSKVLLGMGTADLRPWAGDITARGIARYATQDPVRALQAWQRVPAARDLTDTQVHFAERALAYRSLLRRLDENRGWIDATLPRLKDDELLEIRLRWALKEQDWPVLERLLPLLSDTRQRASVWRFWQAQLAQHKGDVLLASTLLAALATERDYYGFMAADALQASYRFNARARQGDTPLTPTGSAALQRVRELLYHNDSYGASSEWQYVLRRVEPHEQERLAEHAVEEGWYRFSIDAANRADALDRLDLRFPVAFVDSFQSAAVRLDLSSTELMAIARRESAFTPAARSPVGALGLMQLMPATASAVAKQIGRGYQASELFQVETNVLLGSSYYRQLLERFGGNRVLALAAYNAGPGRVQAWRNGGPAKIPVAFWVESIPFRETRDYVQAVLAYNLVFKHQLGQDGALLTPAERAALY